MAEKTSENIVIEILKNQQRVAIKAAVIKHKNCKIMLKIHIIRISRMG